MEDGEYKWNFPKELGTSSGSLPAQNVHQTPRDSTGTDKSISFYQDKIKQTSLIIKWRDEYGKHEEEIKLEISK
ncbi:hypothetical protein [Halobacillus sp. A5]|uniref:hypothetical protein n=1 Tax=Halobacillus sp. A5 TaxID=2880263 RepID=UPI0020A6C3E8|nr:hypothetical protein [Halobacillus sp. A5]MCP3026437.1 hypothetical protein [Halobacillus sp. A5]